MNTESVKNYLEFVGKFYYYCRDYQCLNLPITVIAKNWPKLTKSAEISLMINGQNNNI